MTRKYTINLDLAGKKVVVIGAGGVGARKIKTLVDAGAKVVVVAKAMSPELEDVLQGAEVVGEKYSRQVLDGAVLVIAATDDTALNRRIYADCEQSRILCNVVDVPELCDFYVPAVVMRGDLQIAVSTNGKCPAYAAQLRRKLEGQFGEECGRFLAELDAMRRQVIAEVADMEKRKEILVKLTGDDSFDSFCKNGKKNWQQWAKKQF